MSDELAWTHLVTELPVGGLASERTATEKQRAAVARELDLVSCRALHASYRITPLGAGRYRLAGRLGADVEQACIVTLEPVPARLDEGFDVEFRPEDDPQAAEEGEVEALSAPEIETIDNGRIDAGRIVFEQLAASLDPFPRKDGATLEHTDAGGDGSANPFAVLASLKPKT